MNADGSATFEAYTVDVDYVNPVPPLNIPNPNELDMYDANGNVQFVGGSSSVDGSGVSVSDFSGIDGVTTTTPPPFSTVALSYVNAPTFPSTFQLVGFQPNLVGASRLAADGPFIRELRRRVTT